MKDTCMIYSPRRSSDIRKITLLKKKARYVDPYPEMLRELYLIHHPELKRDPVEARKISDRYLKEESQKQDFMKRGSFVYYPHRHTLVHVIEEPLFYELRSARNRNLITREEQEKIQNATIGIVGLSVGSSALAGLSLMGITRFRIADPDTLDCSNLNRIRAGVMHLGMNKGEVAEEQVRELNPYAKIKVFSKGLTPKTVRAFLGSPKKLDVVVDEMDDLAMKIILRKEARNLRIPIVSAADNGDGAIVDVERHDLRPDYPLFHGDVSEKELDHLPTLPFEERIHLINRMVGFEMVVPRMQQSVSEVGKTLYAWPQLGGAALASGAVVTAAVRKILLGEPVEGGKKSLSIDSFFVH